MPTVLNATALYIPTFLVALGLLVNWARANRTDARLDKIEAMLGDNREASHKDALELMKTIIAS